MRDVENHKHHVVEGFESFSREARVKGQERNQQYVSWHRWSQGKDETVVIMPLHGRAHNIEHIVEESYLDFFVLSISGPQNCDNEVEHQDEIKQQEDNLVNHSNIIVLIYDNLF